MIHYFHEDIVLPSRTKNVGYVLTNIISDFDKEILEDSSRKFYGGFGNRAYYGGNKKYQFILLLPEKLNNLDVFSLYTRRNDFLLIEGTFYDEPLLKRGNNSEKLSNSVEFGKSIYDSLMNGNLTILNNLNGHYSGFAFLESENKLICFNDRFGIKKQFYYHGSNKFLLSNNIYAISTNKYLDISVKNESVSQILQINYAIERNSEFKNIHYLLPSDILINKQNNIEFITNTVTIDRQKQFSNKEYIDILYSKYDNHFSFIKKRINEPIGLFASKGKDSRNFLHFLEKYKFDYKLFNFLGDGGINDTTEVRKIADLLGKDLYFLENYNFDEFEAILLSMNATHTNSWFALSQLAANYLQYIFIGLFGSWSGKLDAFRSYPKIKSKADLAQEIYTGYNHGVEKKELLNIFPHLSTEKDVKESFISSFDKFDTNKLFDLELLHLIDYRMFRNTIPILNKTEHYVTPIFPYLEKNISDFLFQLPKNLIKSQQAHTHIAGLETKTNSVRSTAFPISLKNEKYFRNLILQIIRIDNISKNKLSRFGIKHHDFLVKKETYRPRSSYFQNQLNKEEIKIENRRILSRFVNLDKYLFLSMDSNFEDKCHNLIQIDNI